MYNNNKITVKANYPKKIKAVVQDEKNYTVKVNAGNDKYVTTQLNLDGGEF